MRQNKTLLTIIIIVAIALIGISWGGKTNNALLKYDENVKQAWSQVENQYQRRSDLIPNLVATVRGYATHEQSTLEAVVNARAKATQTTVQLDDLSEESVNNYLQAQGELSSALSRLLVSVESYPERAESE